MKKPLHLLLLIVCTVCIVCPLQANVYYVSANGQNTNDGLTYQTAFKTIQFAADKSQAGDKIFVLPGTYAGFYMKKGGDANNPISFFAYKGTSIESPNTLTEDGIYLDEADYIFIEGFSVYNVPGNGIRTTGSHHVSLKKNTLDYTGKSAILIENSSDLVLEENIASRSKTAHGIYGLDLGSGVSISKNTCRGNNLSGIFIHHNRSILSGAVINNNTVYENGKRGAGIFLSAVHNSRIQGNLLYDNRGRGIVLEKWNNGAGSTDNLLLNNTVVQADDADWALMLRNESTGNKIFNNILCLNNTQVGSTTIDSSSMPGFVCDYNVITNVFYIQGSATPLSMNEWRSVTGQDKHSLIATPEELFENPGSKKYNLLAVSPAIDKGTEIAPYTDGFIGKAPDIGALEYNPAAGINAPVKKYETSFASVREHHQVNMYDLTGKLICSGTKKEVLDNLKQLPEQVFIFEALSEKKEVYACGKMCLKK